jgi:hypothetical protein
MAGKIVLDAAGWAEPSAIRSWRETKRLKVSWRNLTPAASLLNGPKWTSLYRSAWLDHSVVRMLRVAPLGYSLRVSEPRA